MYKNVKKTEHFVFPPTHCNALGYRMLLAVVFRASRCFRVAAE